MSTKEVLASGSPIRGMLGCMNLERFLTHSATRESVARESVVKVAFNSLLIIAVARGFTYIGKGLLVKDILGYLEKECELRLTDVDLESINLLFKSSRLDSESSNEATQAEVVAMRSVMTTAKSLAIGLGIFSDKDLEDGLANLAREDIRLVYHLFVEYGLGTWDDVAQLAESQK